MPGRLSLKCFALGEVVGKTGGKGGEGGGCPRELEGAVTVRMNLFEVFGPQFTYPSIARSPTQALQVTTAEVDRDGRLFQQRHASMMQSILTATSR